MKRRGRDSNPRSGLSPIQHFQCCSFSRSDTSPDRPAGAGRAFYARGPPTVHSAVKHWAGGADNALVTALPAPKFMPPVLSDEHLRQLAVSHVEASKIRRAVAAARFDGWTVATFAALTILLDFTSVESIVLGACLAVVSFVELRAAARLRRLEVGATDTLGKNQLALACVLVIYAVWRIYGVLTGPGVYAGVAGSNSDVAAALQPFEGIGRFISLTMYGALIAIAVFAQGGLALYYFSRGKYVRDYLAQTPAWVVAVQRAGGLG